jgi:hypothetical protein
MSVDRKPYGGSWSLGNIVVPTPGTSVPITNLVDAGGTLGDQGAANEYNVLTAQAITFLGMKAGAGPPALANNAGLIYIVRRGGNKTDLGTVIDVVAPGAKVTITAAAQNRDVLGLQEFAVDADTANDAAQVTAFVQ